MACDGCSLCMDPVDYYGYGERRTGMDVMRVGFGLGYDRDGKPLEHVERLLYGVKACATRMYGGCFLVRGEGVWDSGRGIVSEPGAVLTVYGDISHSGAATFARRIGQLLDQKAVMLEYNGRAEEVQC